jgi:hypothetical protein
VRLQNGVGPTGQGHAAVALAQALAGQVHRNQRRRTGGVDGDAGSLKAKEKGKPPRCRVTAAAGCHVKINQVGVFEEAAFKIVEPHADKNARVAARQFGHGLPGVGQGFPAHLQQQPLLGIQPLRFYRGNTKKVSIKAVDVVQVATPSAHDFARSGGPLVKKALQVHAAGGDFGNRLNFAAQQIPKTLRAVNSSREAAANADNRDGLMFCGQ